MLEILGLARSLVIYHNPVTIFAWRRFYRDLLQPGDLVFDVGAHVGTRSRAMRAAGARVIALEPQAIFAGYLRRTLPADVVLIEAAAGGEEAVAQMAVSSRHPTVSSLKVGFVQGAAQAPGFDHVAWDRTQQVRMVTLDRLIAEYGVPNYIKIDVEGYELEVLSGLSTGIDLISVEYLPGFVDLTLAVLERLADLGEYRFNAIAGERSGFLWSDWQGRAGVEDWLRALPARAPSGDLFARRVT